MARRNSRTVYRRRRIAFALVVVIVLAAVAAGVWAVIAQPWADAGTAPVSTASDSPAASDQPTDAPTGDETPAGEPTTDATPSPEPIVEETPGIASCQAGDVEVQAVTDAESYAAGVLPQLSIQLTNAGAVDCTIDVGSATQWLTVTSGADVWWRSTDCQENPASQVVTLTAGQTVTSAAPVVWDRTRSDPGTCDQENRPRAPGGGASYHVAVSIGGFDSPSTSQIFLY